MMSIWIYVAASCGGILTIMILKKIARLNTLSNVGRDMINKTVIVTGANCGIGKSTAFELVKRNARVIMACRDENSARKAIADIRRKTQNGELVFRHLDLQSFHSVREFCKGFVEDECRLDVLINNAAVMNHPFMQTNDGLEIHMSVNHFGNFLLTNLLLDVLKKSAPSRIVFVSSSLHKYGKVEFGNLSGKQRKPYADSKLANVYFARELAKRLVGSGINVHTVHPGMVNTELSRHSLPKLIRFLLAPLAYFLLPSAGEGCKCVVYCATENLGSETGKYYGRRCSVEEWPEISSDESLWKKMFEISETLTKLHH